MFLAASLFARDINPVNDLMSCGCYYTGGLYWLVGYNSSFSCICYLILNWTYYSCSFYWQDVARLNYGSLQLGYCPGSILTYGIGKSGLVGLFCEIDCRLSSGSFSSAFYCIWWFYWLMKYMWQVRCRLLSSAFFVDLTSLMLFYDWELRAVDSYY